MRKTIILICSECLARNYRVSMKDSDVRFSANKYCKSCDRHTLHVQAK